MRRRLDNSISEPPNQVCHWCQSSHLNGEIGQIVVLVRSRRILSQAFCISITISIVLGKPIL